MYLPQITITSSVKRMNTWISNKLYPWALYDTKNSTWLNNYVYVELDGIHDSTFSQLANSFRRKSRPWITKAVSHYLTAVVVDDHQSALATSVFQVTAGFEGCESSVILLCSLKYCINYTRSVYRVCVSLDLYWWGQRLSPLCGQDFYTIPVVVTVLVYKDPRYLYLPCHQLQ